MKRYGDPALHKTACAVSDAKVLHGFLSVSPFFQVWVIRLDTLQLEVQWSVDNRLLFGLAMSRRLVRQLPFLFWLFLLCPLKKSPVKTQCASSKIFCIVRIKPLHPNAEVEDIALGSATEALPDALIQVCRERGRPARATVAAW